MSLPKPRNDPADVAGSTIRSWLKNRIVKNWHMAHGRMFALLSIITEMR